MSEFITIQIAPQKINFFNRIMEGYEYLGTVTTLDPKEGIVTVRTTPDLFEEVRGIIEHLDFPFVYVDEKYIKKFSLREVRALN